MANNIVLSSAIRSSLLTLQNTADLQSRVQERLATGRKVNSALDNPTNFFTAASLNRRGNDLSALLDGMSNGIKTLEAADNAMKSITRTVETMQANIRAARQDKSFKGVSYSIDGTTIGTATAKNLTFSGGAVGATPVNVGVNTATVSATLGGTVAVANDAALQAFAGDTITITAGSNTVSYAITGTSTKAQLTAALTANGFTAAFDGNNKLAVSRADGSNFTVAGAGGVSLGFAVGTGDTSTDGVVGSVKSVDTLVSDINTALSGKVRASNDGGKLRIENLSTDDLTLVGATAAAVNGGTGNANTTKVGGNDVRKNLITQFNDLRGQLDKLASDASYNGINLLKADKLKITFNETGTSSIEVQAKNTAGTVRGISTESTSLDIAVADGTEFSDDTKLDARLDKLSDALTVLQTQSSSFGASLATVQIRQEFTKSMIGTLQGGADNLTLADSNEEGANLLALNTRQQLAQTALSLASQASQAVLRLF
ncbi:MAG TPA: flagellin [Beijerinckiaceae bacterium]|jgi:flagellin-like hook-associated protein FlgL